MPQPAGADVTCLRSVPLTIPTIEKGGKGLPSSFPSFRSSILPQTSFLPCPGPFSFHFDGRHWEGREDARNDNRKGTRKGGGGGQEGGGAGTDSKEETIEVVPCCTEPPRASRIEAPKINVPHSHPSEFKFEDYEVSGFTKFRRQLPFEEKAKSSDWTLLESLSSSLPGKPAHFLVCTSR
jgi:hypothetical protein